MESIQNEEARIVTGAIKGTNKRRLLNEPCWDDMKRERLLHKLIPLYKIINSNTPSYLRDIVHVRVNERTRYSLMSNDNSTPIPKRTKRFKQSFLPAQPLSI